MSDEIEAIGALTTAGLVGRSLWRRTGAPRGEKGGHDAVCANCGTALVGDYCHACGQLGHVHRSISHMGEELLHGVAHFDGKTWRTLPLLAFKPGRLTRDYIDGKRATYVSPMGLFLFVVFLMFLVFSFAHGSPGDAVSMLDNQGGPVSTVARKTIQAEFQARAAEARRQLDADTQADRDPTVAAAEAVSAWENAAATAGGRTAKHATGKDGGIGSAGTVNVNTGLPALDEVIRHFTDNPELALYKLKNTAYKFSFLLVPISLPFIWALFFWRRDVTMYDHAVFALYSLSFMSLLVSAAVLLSGVRGIQTGVVGLAVALIVPVHMYKHLRYTYGLTRAGTLWRTLALLLFSAVALSLFAAAILAVGLAE